MTNRVLLAITLSFAVPLITRADEPKAAELPTELKWIPANAAAFVHVRFAQLWNGPAGKPFRDTMMRDGPDGLQRVEQAIGVPLGQIDRLTLVIPNAGGSSADASLVLRIRTVEAYDADGVRKSLGLRGGPRLSNVAELPNSGGLIQFTDAKSITFVYSRGRAAALLARLETAESAGRLAPALKLAADDHLIVAAADISQMRELSWMAEWPEARAYFIARSAMLVGDIKPAGLELSVRVATGLRSHAEEVAEALERSRAEAVKALTAAVRELASAPEGHGRAKLLESLAAAVKAGKVEHREKEVTAATSLAEPGALAALALEGVEAVQSSANRTRGQNNLKQVGLAFHNYHDTYGKLPSAIRDKQGKPLLSWRVAILPYIEEDQLYRQFKLDEPWDSEHNKKLIAKMPRIYMLPGERKQYELPSTHYRVFIGNGAMFEPKIDTNFAMITDGLSNTIMAAEALEAVPWSKPDEIEYDPKKPPKLNYVYGRANVLMGDGSVRTLRKGLPESTLHLLIQRADGNVIPNID